MRTAVTRSRATRAAIGALVVAWAFIACDALSPSQAPASPSQTAALPTGTPLSTATGPLPTTAPTAAADCAAVTLASMSESQQVGQLFMPSLVADTVPTAIASAINAWNLGNVWYRRTNTGVTAIRAVSDRIQAMATVAATDGVGFFIGANQEGGEIQGLAGPGFATIPSAVVQGTWTPATLQSRARLWGAQLLAAGVNVDFAPVSDVVPAGTEATNAPIGQLFREFGSTPSTVAAHVAAFIAGMHGAGVATTAKHFPGLGRVVGNTDNTAQVVDDVTTTTDPYLGPFRTAIASGTELVMVSEATYTRIDPANLAIFSSTIVGSLLRDRLGFDGVIVSDTLTATAVSAIAPADRAIRFLDAGGDLLVLNDIQVAGVMARAVLARASADATFRARVEEAARRILKAKVAAGLIACP